MKGTEYYDCEHDSPGGTGLKKMQWPRFQLKVCILKPLHSNQHLRVETLHLSWASRQKEVGRVFALEEFTV